ncbi:hypothetical protein [Lewinella sp. W8]|uniref:hypothetical protein n=1 Tax=Lewinella sp. W8 TaxID=2528208 RepID=UPI00106820A7|nr:hypothetical protein [Lewinella sp. W8]MTB52748.1 hypothetical protein [Lewinella sp. W8]
MSKTLLFVIAALGILILLGTIVYQARTGESALLMVPVGLFLTMGAAIALMRMGSKQEQE